MNWSGILLAVVTFFVIGVFHPIVIKCEYYFSDRCWPVFLVVGVACLIISLFIESMLVAAIVGVIGCSCLWSIGELKEQTERVRKGWFPANPNRKDNKKK